MSDSNESETNMTGILTWTEKYVKGMQVRPVHKETVTIHCPYRVHYPNGGSSLYGFIIDAKGQWVMAGKNRDEWSTIKAVKGVENFDKAGLTPFIDNCFINWSWEI